MTTLPPELRDLIATGPLGHLVTVNQDGSPQVSVIWIGLDGDDIVSGHMDLHLKLRNLRRDPRFALSFEAPRTPGVFLAEHAVLRGTAVVEEGGAHALLTRLAPVYVAPGFSFPAPADAPGYIVRYSPDRISGVGPWAIPGPTT
ncbi:PPOX class F420-dependent oxidoreductase [Streptomyces sp. JH14]|uniref:PPOX class F420-dependent oxidoreductase n=1 Tax=Streptomyces sp. JH14 TaxID=2793630 RepID=UPI0023F84447|nr:PPOX class F420-dependent oxidoreductase [Streptomyces sp. JH14]MDF6043194.1 PPOX class F420-dependent oxidoreductase [Streptomyces sp. JH14]